MSDFDLYCDDCMDILPQLPGGSIDAIITDLPYGRTILDWDEIIPLEEMWLQVKRLLRPEGVFVTTAQQPFTSRLIMSNLEWFKYTWVWDKGVGGAFTIVKFKPFISSEDICVFARNGKSTYNPQMVVKGGKQKRGGYGGSASSMYRLEPWKKVYTGAYYPKNIIKIPRISQNTHLHPTQKPVRLYEYLVLTYTNENETVLDFCMGSGTTGVACIQTKRKFIGIENNKQYFDVAKERIEKMHGFIRKDSTCAVGMEQIRE